MRVKDVMSHDVIGVSPLATVAEALDIMRRARVSGLPVIDETGTLVGIISEADFLRALNSARKSQVATGWFRSFDRVTPRRSMRVRMAGSSRTL
jgi:CBS domain-containing protein